VDIDIKFLQQARGNIFQCEGYEMFGTEEDTIETLIYGCKSAGYCKPVLFKRESFIETNFTPGSHSAKPEPVEGQSVQWVLHSPNLYHTKWRSWTNGIERAHLLAKKRSEHSKLSGWNIHYEFDDNVHLDYYSSGIKNRVKVR